LNEAKKMRFYCKGCEWYYGKFRLGLVTLLTGCVCISNSRYILLKKEDNNIMEDERLKVK
jgi:hypothetical protein